MTVDRARKAEPRDRPSRWDVVVAVVVWIGAFAFAVATYGLSDDHFGRISPARQIARYGELPFRDFFDPGYYLTELSSAWLQRLLGDSLLAEALLNTTFIATGALFVALVVRRITRSAVAGAAAAFVAVASMPRDYDFDKFLFYPLGVWLVCRYVDRRTIGSLALLAVAIVVAALYRYDNGIYIALAALVALAVLHWRERSLLWGRTALLVVTVAVLSAPVLLVLERNGGVVDAARQTLTYARRETSRSRLHGMPPFHLAPPPETPAAPPPEVIQVRWSATVDAGTRAALEAKYRLRDGTPRGEPADRTWSYRAEDVTQSNLRALVSDPQVEDTNGIDRSRLTLAEKEAAGPSRLAVWWSRVATIGNATSWLFYVFILLPIVTAFVVGRRLRGGAAGDQRLEAARGLGLATLCLLVGALILRDPLYARIGGAIAPGLLLVAWFARDAWATRPRSLLRAGAAAVLVVVTVASVGVMAEWRVTLPRTRANLPHVAGLLGALAASPPSLEFLPNSRIAGLVTYVRDCTAPADRVYAAWFVPELYFFAQRPFAGGMVVTFGRHWSEPENQQRIVDRLRGQSVPIVILQTARDRRFGEDYPLVEAYLQQHYRVAGRSQFRSRGADDEGYTLLVDQRRTPVRPHQPSGMPCFR